ncbi:MAG: type II toxin-antitoxin system HicB family antitoxin [Pirellulaceae bacterium]
MRFAILIEPTATGYSGHVPDLPGCVAAGETRDETIQLLREAIEFHLEGMRLHGETAPPPCSTCEYVEVDVSLAGSS